MIANFRRFAKSGFATVLIGLLIVSFGVWGVRDVFKGQVTNQVIVAGKRTLGPQDFKVEFDRARKGLEQQVGQPVSQEMAVENKFDVRLLDELATRESFTALLQKIGVHPSDKLISEQIEKIPAFFDRVSGRFDKTLYAQTLGQNNLTVPRFESGIRDEIAQQHVVSAMVNGLRVPRAYGALGAIYETESRDVGYFPLDPRAVPPVTPPTDAQLTKFMNENAAALMKPEFRILTVVRFSPAVMGAGLPITDADIQKQFDFRKDTLNKPELRSLVQIPGKDAKTAQAIAARLTKGEDAAAIARSVGVEAIVYADKPKTAIADPKVGVAAFNMAAGAVQVVQGDLGPAVVKVDKITPGHVATIAEVRPMLEAEARKTVAAEKVEALSQKYDDAHAGGASLSESAQKAGAPTLTVGPVSAQGGDPQGQRAANVSPKLVQVAFSLPQGGESEIEDEGNGEYFAVRVEKIIPKALPTLDEVRARLTQVWMARETAKALQAKADQLVERLKKGESLDAVAASVNAQVSHAAGLTRQNAAQNKELSQDALAKAFGAKAGEVFTAENAKAFGLVVGKLEALRAPVPVQIARITEDSRPQMSMAIFREIGVDARKAARDTVKPKIYPNVARAALGLEPIDPKAKKPPEKAK
jgi:peptidyl-prolyl cis-trans isomerase D